MDDARLKNRHFMSPSEFRGLVDSKPHTYDDGCPVYRVQATGAKIRELLNMRNRIHVTGFGDVAFTMSDLGDRPVAIVFSS